MRPETLLAKFDLKGINYEPHKGGKGLFSLEVIVIKLIVSVLQLTTIEIN